MIPSVTSRVIAQQASLVSRAKTSFPATAPLKHVAHNIPPGLNTQTRSYLTGLSQPAPFRLPDVQDAVKPHFRLTPKEGAAFGRRIAEAPYDPKGSHDYLCEMRKIAFNTLPDRVLNQLSSFNLPDSPLSHLVIDNIPIDRDVTGSPAKGERSLDFKSGSVSENALVSVASVLNQVYAVNHESPEIVANLVPSLQAKGQYTGEGFDRELGPHTENARQTHMPLGNAAPTELSLLGVRGEPNGDGPHTMAYDGRRALTKLSETDRNLLRQPLYEISTPHRWRTGDTSKPGSDSVTASIVSGPDSAPQIAVAFYPGMVKVKPDLPAPLAYATQQALDRFKNSLTPHAVKLHPGRLLVVNNRYALHAREKFDATFDKNGRANRWVQRAFTGTAWNHRGFDRLHPSVYAPTGLPPEAGRAATSEAAPPEPSASTDSNRSIS